MPLCFHSYFSAFLLSLVQFRSSLLLCFTFQFFYSAMSSLLCNYPNNCSFQYYIFQFQKSHLFIVPSFFPCLFLCFIKHIGIRVLRSSSANSIISVISEAALNDCFFNINLFILIGGLLLYNILLVLPYINMHSPWVFTCSPS